MLENLPLLQTICHMGWEESVSDSVQHRAGRCVAWPDVAGRMLVFVAWCRGERVRTRAGLAQCLQGELTSGSAVCPSGPCSTDWLAPISCREQGKPFCPAWVHDPIVPTNNRRDKRVLELMTQTQVRRAAGWMLKGSTVRAAGTAPACPALPG